jgi:hypothetical protein
MCERSVTVTTLLMGYLAVRSGEKRAEMNKHQCLWLLLQRLPRRAFYGALCNALLDEMRSSLRPIIRGLTLNDGPRGYGTNGDTREERSEQEEILGADNDLQRHKNFQCAVV